MSLLKDVLNFSEELTIVINEGNPELSRKFTITQGFLTEHLANEWVEASTRTIKIPDVNNDTFCAYLYWMHKEKIPFETDCDFRGCPVLWHDEARPVLDETIKLWLPADRLMTAKLRNDAADAIIRVLDILHEESDMEEIFPASTITLIWPATTEDRAIRRIVGDWYAYIVHSKAAEDKIEHYHPEFVRELTSKLLSIAQKSTRNVHPTLKKTGHYHELDKPQPESNIHGNATIEFIDRDGVSIQAQSSLFATPRGCIDAVNKATKCKGFEPDVKLQIEEDSWLMINETQWDDTLRKLSESNHYMRVSIRMCFGHFKFPDELVEQGLSRISDGIWLE